MTEPETATEVEARAESDFVGDDDASAEAEVVRRDAGVRLRTNVQAGSASERVNVTLETNALDLPDLVEKLPTHREVLYEEVTEAREHAKEVNE